MSRVTLLKLLPLLALLALGACSETATDDDDSSSGDDDDTGSGDDDTSADDDDSSAPGDDDTNSGDDDTVAVVAPPGSVLCAAGGRVSSAEGITGVVCTSPVDLASGHQATSADGSLIWQPGPITRLAP